jgi:hypothetical protein
MPVFKAFFEVNDPLQAIDQNYRMTFHVTEDGTSDQAYQDALQVAEAFQGTLLPDDCQIVKVGISNPDVLNGNRTRLVALDGARAATGARLPSWNTVKFQAQSSLGGRPSTFHLRCGLTEDDVTGQNLTSAMVTAVQSFATALGLQSAMCKPDGARFEIYTFDSLVRNRQQGWHRRTRPGFHRGWVPNAV